jgi:hypothetical protein
MAAGDETFGGEEEVCTKDTGNSTDEQPKAFGVEEEPTTTAKTPSLKLYPDSSSNSQKMR